MLKRLNPTIITSLLTAVGMIAFAFYKDSIAVPAVAFYIAAAAIALLPAVYASTCRKSRQNRMSKAQ